MFPYYIGVLVLSVAHVVLAAIAYRQRAKQIRSNALRERQVTLADEARLAFAGATMAPAAAVANSAFFCDVGGGSTEVAVGSLRDGVVASESFDVGAFVLAERHFRHDPPTSSELAAARAEAEEAVKLDMELPARLALATGGSARAVARLAGRMVGKEELSAALTKALSDRRAAKNPHRRRSLPAGIVILDVLQSAVGLPLTIAAGGLREGVLLHRSGLDQPRPAEALERAAA